MPKGVPNKRYTAEFKKLVIETMQEEKLSYSETCRRFDVNSRDQIKSWERIYLEEGPEGFAIERRGRGGRLPKKFASLGFGRRATPAQKTLVVQKLRQKHALSILLSIAQLPRATFYYHLKQMQREDKYASVKPANKKSSPQADLTKENIAGSGRRKAQHQKAAANTPTCRA